MNYVKIGLTAFCALLAILFGLWLYASIEHPIHFQNEWSKREQDVRKNLGELAELQKMYKGLTNRYAPNYEDLRRHLMEDTFRIEKVLGDPNDSTVQVVRKIVAIPAVDSLQAFVRKQGYENMSATQYLDFVIKVPHATDGASFYIKADSVAVDAEGTTFLPTFEIGTMIGAYMMEFDSADYAIYDPRYNPVNKRKIGDLSKPSSSGNW